MIGRRLFFGLMAAAPVAAAKAMDDAVEVALPSPQAPVVDDFNMPVSGARSELDRDYWWARDVLGSAQYLRDVHTSELPYPVTVPRSWSGAFRRHVAARALIERERKKHRNAGREVTERMKKALVRKMMGG